MDNKRKRTIAAMTCFIFLLVTLCSILLIVKEADHVCTGTDCPICAQIQEAENILKRREKAVLSAKNAVIPFNICFSLPFVIGVHRVLYTINVKHRMRMNN